MTMNAIYKLIMQRYLWHRLCKDI